MPACGKIFRRPRAVAARAKVPAAAATAVPKEAADVTTLIGPDRQDANRARRETPIVFMTKETNNSWFWLS